MLNISFHKTLNTGRTGIHWSTGGKRFPRHTDESLAVPVEGERLLLHDLSVEAVLVLHYVHAPTSNTSTKRKGPNLCTLRGLIATDGRMYIPTSAYETPNVGKKAFVGCPELGILSDRPSGSNTSQSCSALLHTAPINSWRQPDPHRQRIQITAVRLLHKEMSTCIHLHGRGHAGRSAYPSARTSIGFANTTQGKGSC